MTDKKPKYKLETWHVKKWKGTARETTVTTQRLVMREKGHFVKGKPIITKIQIKNYAKGVYRVGLVGNKIVVRQKIGEKTVQWWQERKEVIDKRQIFRSSYVLNNILISKVYSFFKYADRSGKESWTVGFRINAFSRNRQALAELKPKLKQRLIKFIEQTLEYNTVEWWFDSYFGYEAPTNVNTSKAENGKYYLTLENQRGYVIKSEEGRLSDL